VKPVVVQRRAEQDLFDAVGHYASGTASVVDRFLAEVDRVMALIGRSPHIGSSSFAEQLDVPGLRCQPLKGFPCEAFYLPDDVQVTVIRVLHHARDIASLLDMD
jgi:toxin ParE1/3/4